MLLVAALLQKSYELDIQAGSSRSFLGWIILGLIAGWLAGKLVRGEGFGCIGDVILGLIGSVIGGWLFTKLGIVHANTFLYSLAAATVGAVILVAIAHLFFGGSKS
jgi:uncharacterized membrane protein YeaQ/YmgE (transglycosylase-associated protein family)